MTRAHGEGFADPEGRPAAGPRGSIGICTVLTVLVHRVRRTYKCSGTVTRHLSQIHVCSSTYIPGHTCTV